MKISLLFKLNSQMLSFLFQGEVPKAGCFFLQELATHQLRKGKTRLRARIVNYQTQFPLWGLGGL